MSSPSITYTPHSAITAEQARDARACAWAYAFACFNHRVSKEAAPESRPDARKENSNASGKPSIPRPS
jgi:hypothetical protein